MKNLENSPLMDYSDFKKLYESAELFEDEKGREMIKTLDDLASKIDISSTEVKNAVEEEVGKTVDKIEIPEKIEEDLNEALLTIAGAVLSLGKLSELAGKGVSFAGKKLNLKGLENVGQWMKEKGHAYTHGIEKLIIKALEVIPAYKKASKETQETWAKYILVALIGGLAVSSGFELVHALKDGHALLTAVEGALTGAKASEVSELIGHLAGKTVAELA